MARLTGAGHFASLVGTAAADGAPHNPAIGKPNVNTADPSPVTAVDLGYRGGWKPFDVPAQAAAERGASAPADALHQHGDLAYRGDFLLVLVAP